MKDAIEFIKHGVLNRQFNEAYTQIHACGDYIQSHNGFITMSHTLMGIGTFAVSSTKLISAIKACGYKPDLSLGDKYITLSRNKFRARLPFSSELNKVKPDKDNIKRIKTPVMDTIKSMYPYISEDASRIWSQSILSKKGYLYVTNNVMIVRAECKLPAGVYPIQLIAAMMKVNKEPTHIAVCDRSITVYYDDTTWIRSSTIAETWPDIIGMFKDIKFKEVPRILDDFRECVEMIEPFVEDDIIQIRDGKMVTPTGEIDDVDLPNMAFSLTIIKKVLAGFERCDLTRYPEPMLVIGENLEGAFMGMMINEQI